MTYQSGGAHLVVVEVSNVLAALTTRSKLDRRREALELDVAPGGVILCVVGQRRGCWDPRRRGVLVVGQRRARRRCDDGGERRRRERVAHVKAALLAFLGPVLGVYHLILS